MSTESTTHPQPRTKWGTFTAKQPAGFDAADTAEATRMFNELTRERPGADAATRLLMTEIAKCYLRTLQIDREIEKRGPGAARNGATWKTRERWSDRYTRLLRQLETFDRRRRR